MMGLLSWFRGRGQSGLGQGEDDEFIDFLTGAMNALGAASQAHSESWGLGEEESWEFDQDSGLLRFMFADRIVETSAQIIGSHAETDGSWLWSWANRSLVGRLSTHARKLRAWGQQQGIKRLTTASWPATDQQAWAMTALACRINEVGGAYRGPGEGVDVYFAFDEVGIQRRD